MNNEQEKFLLEKPFKVLDLKPILSDDIVIGFNTTVFLKDAKAVDDFAKWYKKEILKIKI